MRRNANYNIIRGNMESDKNGKVPSNADDFGRLAVLKPMAHCHVWTDASVLSTDFSGRCYDGCS